MFYGDKLGDNMSFEVPLTVQYGAVEVVAHYHTITGITFNFRKLPEFDQNMDILQEGTKCFVEITSFENKSIYDANRGDADLKGLRSKTYEVPFLVAIMSQRYIDPVLTPEQKAYDFIKTVDSDFTNALDVP
jgi:hypothetical protein